MTHTLSLKQIEDVTHDTKHLVFDRPEGFTFEPGQACEMTLQREGWKDEGRPFTMTSLPNEKTLEFVIKTYPDHNGVTDQIATLSPGEQVTLSEPFGAISDQGVGLFVAGGAGITPFIPILRARHMAGTLDGCRLIFANKSRADIILHDEWDRMDGLQTLFLTDADDDLPSGPLDEHRLSPLINPDDHVYVCGPQGLIDGVRDAARSLGHPEDRLVIEDGW